MENKEEDNIKLWKLVESTDDKYKKEVTQTGRRFTAIDAHYQLLQGTKIWGSFGRDWGVKNEGFNNVIIGQKLIGDIRADLIICLYTATLFYPNGELPINSAIKISYVTSNGKHKIDEDYSKKVATNAFTKGLSKLGFSADVFMGAYDGNMYEGISNTGIDIPADESQINILKLYEKQLNLTHPDKSMWINKMINNNLSFDYANIVIKKTEDFIDANK